MGGVWRGGSSEGMGVGDDVERVAEVGFMGGGGGRTVANKVEQSRNRWLGPGPRTAVAWIRC